ncbi:MAG: glycosyltransferase family 9 protein [candidate division Zixibacteria bacterium]|nr:glycosyltransferase family 9 protein [candidate division Zixibacteria bacterium]
MTRLLIIRSGALGDFILTLPVLDALRARFPGVQVDVLGNRAFVRLAMDGGHANECLDIDRSDMATLFTPHASPFLGLADRLRRYDLAVTFFPDRDGVLKKNLLRGGVGRVIAIPYTPDPQRRIHMTYRFMEPLTALGIAPLPPPPRLNRPQTTTAPVDEQEPCVVVHPGSGGLRKCWPAERYAALCDALTKRGVRVTLTAGPADTKTVEAVADRLRHPIPVADNLTLSEMAAFLRRSRALVGNDSGIAHLAAAVGVSVTAIFGPTDPAVWGPRGDHVRILWGRDVFSGDIGYVDWEGDGNPRPLEDVTVERVLEVLCFF